MIFHNANFNEEKMQSKQTFLTTDIAQLIRSISIFSGIEDFATKKCTENAIICDFFSIKRARKMIMYHRIECMRCNWTQTEYMNLLF